MDYIPVFTGDDEDGSTLTLSPGRLQRTGVRSEAAEMRPLTTTVRAAGTVQIDERQVERTREVPSTLAWPSPRTGIVLDRAAVEGMKAPAGETLFQLADISVVWVLADVPESALPLIALGQSVTVRPRGSAKTFGGRVALVYPSINKDTRTARLRVELPNPDGALLPDMFADLEIATGADAPVLTVAYTAVIDSGDRKVVILDKGDGNFKPRPVQTGRRGSGLVEITDGLADGDRVVTSANFLIDAAPKLLRCALYTRVSTDHGLDQEFNSLDNQREAAQAYVKSQAHEGWRPVRDRYDDGGFSGGSLERPALQKLLADIRDRRIDVVVVYKVDRLTRSLADFAKLVELFDAHGVSFVSVTQSFNTTSSMGRLTLNVLLSFAQFEREVTGERIRDKIAASKRKGIWVGGVIPFGYALVDRKLVVDDAEATIVRMIFARYLALGSLPALQRELRVQGVVTRQRFLSSGTIRGGVPLTNGPLGHVLRNRVYRGELNHKGQSYSAEHQAIVNADLFDAVQGRLDANRQAHTGRRQHADALLTGLVYDDRDNRMGPSYAIKNGLRYRYYVSAATVQGRKADAGSVARVPAQDLETAVLDALAAAGHDLPSPVDRDGLAALVERITIGPGRIDIRLAEQPEGAPEPITVAWTPPTQHRRREIVGPADDDAAGRPIRAEARARLLHGIARGRAWLDAIMSGAVPDLDALAAREAISPRAARMTLSLAFLAPDIVQAAADGSLPRGFSLSRLTDLPPRWDEQRRVLGSGLNQHQNATMLASATAEAKLAASLS